MHDKSLRCLPCHSSVGQIMAPRTSRTRRVVCTRKVSRDGGLCCTDDARANASCACRIICRVGKTHGITCCSRYGRAIILLCGRCWVERLVVAFSCSCASYRKTLRVGLVGMARVVGGSGSASGVAFAVNDFLILVVTRGPKNKLVKLKRLDLEQ